MERQVGRQPYGEILSDARAKIERAKVNLRTLDSGVGSLLASQPFEIASRQNLQTAELVYYAAKVDPIPLSLAAASADILHNLRKALDYMVVNSIRAAGNHPNRNSGFPICASYSIYGAQSAEKLRGVNQHTMEAIAAMKPDRGGNIALWALQSLDSVEKHHLVRLVPVAIRFSQITPDVLEYARRIWISHYGSWRPIEAFTSKSASFIESIKRHFGLTKGDVVFIARPRSEATDEQEFSFELAFGERETGGMPLMELFECLLIEVETVVATLGAL